MLTVALIVVTACALLAWIPCVLLITHRDRVRSFKRRPVNEVLADAYAEGRITHERFEALMDEVHRSLPTPDAPYPLVKDVTIR